MNGSSTTTPRNPRSNALAQKSSSSNDGISSSKPPAVSHTRRRMSVDACGTPPVAIASTNVGGAGFQMKLASPKCRMAQLTKSMFAWASSRPGAAAWSVYDARPVAPQPGDERACRGIARRIVDDDDLVRRAGLALHAVERFEQEIAEITAGDDDG